MYFRCSDCSSATWVHGVDSRATSQTLKCGGCGRGFTVRTAQNLSPDPREQYETARALAEGNGFDLPTSYSVMLGIMTLEHALVLRERGVPPVEDAASHPAAGRQDAPGGAGAGRASESGAAPVAEYDPAFADAVTEGYLSAQQAVERGERKAYARRLVDRHGLSESLACLVADNRISLSAALRKDREEVDEVLRPVRVAVWKKALAAAVAGAALVGIGVYGIHLGVHLEQENRKVEAWAETVSSKLEKEREAERRARPAEAPRTVPRRRVRLLQDEQGRLTEIEGPDPSSILLAYCANQEPAGRFRPLELATPVPPFPGTRLGVFVDDEDLGKRYAIRIRRTIDGRRWIAGDGRDPIVADPAPRAGAGESVPVLVNRSPSGDS